MKLVRYAVVAMLLASTSASATEKTLPEGIRIIQQDESKTCEFVDIVTAMKFALLSASATQRGALIDALEKAKAKGANAALITEMTVHNNQHQVTLTAFKCK